MREQFGFLPTHTLKREPTSPEVEGTSFAVQTERDVSRERGPTRSKCEEREHARPSGELSAVEGWSGILENQQNLGLWQQSSHPLKLQCSLQCQEWLAVKREDQGLSELLLPLMAQSERRQFLQLWESSIRQQGAAHMTFVNEAFRWEVGWQVQKIPATGALLQGYLKRTPLEQHVGHWQQKVQQLERNQRLLRDLLDSVAHDVRGPLSRLRLRLQSAFGLQRPEQFHSTVASLISETQHIQNLLEAYFQQPDPENPFAELDLNQIDLGVLLREVTTAFQVTAEERQVKLGLDLLEEELSVCADATKLRQVFSNLLQNALQHTAAGGTVTCRVSQVQENWVTVEVRDTGCGIASYLLPRIFEKYVRGAHRQPGSGLGLFIARSIVQAHGGLIKAQSRLQEGTIFVVRLPKFRISRD
jgi:signal transduction histidine kinase